MSDGEVPSQQNSPTVPDTPAPAGLRLRGMACPTVLESSQQAKNWIEIVEVELARCLRAKAKADSARAGTWSTLPPMVATVPVTMWLTVAVVQAGVGGRVDPPAQWFFTVLFLLVLAYFVAWAMHEYVMPWVQKDTNASWRKNEEWVVCLEDLLLSYKRQLRELELAEKP